MKKCSATTLRGTPCSGSACENGLCNNHGGKSSIEWKKAQQKVRQDRWVNKLGYSVYRERTNKTARAWSKKNTRKRSATVKAWQKKNSDWMKEWRLKNKAHLYDKTKKSYYKHREKRVAGSMEWVRSNRARVYANRFFKKYGELGEVRFVAVVLEKAGKQKLSVAEARARIRVARDVFRQRSKEGSQ
jgi:hypothetical protein